jgi:60 kDa SS-A/Ro ribonucleoprotein
LHPLSVYIAKKTYESGQGILGSGNWTVNTNIVDSLEDAFYNTFDLVEPTNKNLMFCLDVSGSMGMSMAGNIKCVEVCAIMAMVGIRSEPFTFVGGFASSFVDLKITKKDNLNTAVKKCIDNNFGYTNPGAAIDYAIKNKLPVDSFIVITDNEVNGGGHVSQHLSSFRSKMNKQNAKMIVCGLTATNFTIADPKDPNQLDIAGFSPDLTSVISSFVRD